MTDTRGITPADIAAAADVVRAAGESADSIGFEEAAELRQALVALTMATKDSLALLNGELLRMVEAQPRRHDGITYDRRPKRAWRFDHELVRSRIVDAVAGTGNRSVVMDALDLHSAIYVSPSTIAKVGGLEKIGLTKKEAGTYENQGYELEVVDTNIRDED
jgi:hypothetical protein